MLLPRCLLFCLLALPAPLHALVIRAYNGTDHDRFTGFPTAPVKNGSFIHQATDLSGIGWYDLDRRRQYTMVSPKHFVGANHYKPSTTGKLRFLASDGTVKTYAIGSTQSILNGDGDATDLFIGTLEEEILPVDGVNFQPFLSLPAEANYHGQSLIFLGRGSNANLSHRGGIGTIEAFLDFGADPLTSGANINSTRAYSVAYNTVIGNNNDAHVESGDSGSPSLVAVNGKGALVGTHTAVLSAVGTVTSIDTFVPHYVDELNAIMEADGYHMTRAVPAGFPQPATSLTVAPTLPPVIRAGYPFSISLQVNNTGATDDANNVKVVQTFPAGTSHISVSGNLWIRQANANVIVARRGGIGTLSSETLTSQTTLNQPGTYDVSVTFSADEFAETAQVIPMDVIESFRSWSDSLTNPTEDGDDDQDGVNNLLEYAFGGDPAVNSRFRSDGTTVLLPRIRKGQTNNTTEFEFIRRKDADSRALDYVIETSTTLLANSWSEVDESEGASQLAVLDADFEKVTKTYTLSDSPRFYRIRITLSEN